MFNKQNWRCLFILIGLIIFNNNINALEQLDCIIEPHSTVEVSSATTGILASVLVNRGDKVKKGQLLARLQSGVEEANVKLAKLRARSKSNIKEKQARYQLNQRTQARVEELFEKNAISDLERDEARTRTTIAKYELEKARVDHQIAQLELKRAQEILKRRSIISSIEGIVVERFKSPGEYVDNQQQPVLKLAQIDLLNVEVIAPISLLDTIKPDMSATVIPETNHGEKYIAKVAIVDAIIDAASGTFGIRLHLPNPNNAIRAGLNCQIEFITTNHD